jgi:hypothetical protein
LQHQPFYLGTCHGTKTLLFLQIFCQTSKHPLDKSSATLSGSLFCPRPATQERS